MQTRVGFEENEISVNSKGGTELTKRSIAANLDSELVDNFQVICSRVRELNDNKIRIYWLHDLPEDPESTHLQNESARKRFHKMVYSSNWQYQQFLTKLKIPQTSQSVVIETPITPIPYVEKSKDEVRLIYFSTPHRGLEILVPVFEKLCETHDNIVLDVFSSFKIYGWDNADDPYQKLFERCKQHPKINYHGFQPNEIVRETLQRAHIFAYPSIWEETSCRCLIESMSSGLLCVHPNFAALPDTSGGLTSMYNYDENKNIHAQEFFNYLNHAINVVNTQDVQNHLKFVKTYADSRFNLDNISNRWKNLMENLLIQYPNETSRMTEKNYFRYTT